MSDILSIHSRWWPLHPWEESIPIRDGLVVLKRKELNADELIGQGTERSWSWPLSCNATVVEWLQCEVASSWDRCVWSELHQLLAKGSFWEADDVEIDRTVSVNCIEQDVIEAVDTVEALDDVIVTVERADSYKNLELPAKKNRRIIHCF